MTATTTSTPATATAIHSAPRSRADGPPAIGVDARLQRHVEVLQALLGNYLDHLARSWLGGPDTASSVQSILAAVGRPVEVSTELAEHVANVERSLVAMGDGPLARLVNRLGLGFGDELLVAATWWTELDPQLGSVFGVLHDDGHRRAPSSGLLHLVAAPFGIDVPVHPGRLIEAGVIATDGPHGGLRLTATARQLLQGREPATLATDPLLDRLHRLVDPVAALLARPRPVVVLRGVPGSGRRSLAAAVCARRGLLALDGERRSDELQLLTRLGIGVPVIGAEAAAELPAELAAGPLLILAEPDDEIGSASVVDVPLPPKAERALLWAAAASELGFDLDSDGNIDTNADTDTDPLVEALADRFLFAERDIEDATARTRLAAEIAGRAPAPNDLWTAAQRQPDVDLARVATRIEPAFTLEDLVLADEASVKLRELVAHVRHRSIVLDRWGFGARLPRGRGVAALFTGPPGTGKTTAAEAVARELTTELYRVDLSRVVSKYIGETEKNLAIAFREAERSGALLLFDEADALFGKRTDVRDAHDRYANLEVSYLLQRIETFSGMIILSTNKPGNIDEAFQRRLRFAIRFDQPDTALRSELWRRSFPAGAALAEVDFDHLARHDLSGGHIQTAALSAAFLAAADGGPDGAVNHRHLSQAIGREYEKLNRAAPDPESEVV